MDADCPKIVPVWGMERVIMYYYNAQRYEKVFILNQEEFFPWRKP
jgi:hypothetical protein